MKLLPVVLFFSLSSLMYGQNKYSHIHFDKLTEIQGTEYVVARVEEQGKLPKVTEKSLLFINTKNGDSHHVIFDKKAYIGEAIQAKIDSLGINLILIPTKTVDLDGKKGIGWNDPMQIITLSTDGKKKKQLTDDNFFVRNWTVNKETGRAVIVGYKDTNNNKKYDKTDQSEIQIYDLHTLELVHNL
ncbi:hypothetical protein M1B74_12795 [Bacteroides pyogenes]|uniref:hypothetical protein n=1 Tax=Bacteroides pyogenes TaxID=310300 RepID=UPI003B430E68